MTKAKKRETWADENMRALYQMTEYLVQEHADALELWAKESEMPLIPIQTALLFKGQILAAIKKQMQKLTMAQLRTGLAEQFKVEFISWELLAKISQPGYMAQAMSEAATPQELLDRLAKDARGLWELAETRYAHLALPWNEGSDGTD